MRARLHSIIGGHLVGDEEEAGLMIPSLHLRPHYRIHPPIRHLHPEARYLVPPAVILTLGRVAAVRYLGDFDFREAARKISTEDDRGWRGRTYAFACL